MYHPLNEEIDNGFFTTCECGQPIDLVDTANRTYSICYDVNGDILTRTCPHGYVVTDYTEEGNV